MGIKFGLNGVDNARIKFSNKRIARVNMLNRYADVNEDGVFICDTNNLNARFFRVIERLISGRLCIAAMMSACARSSLYIALKYAQSRLSIGPSGKSTVPIINY